MSWVKSLGHYVNINRFDLIVVEKDKIDGSFLVKGGFWGYGGVIDYDREVFLFCGDKDRVKMFLEKALGKDFDLIHELKEDDNQQTV